jgi:UDP:flavonoid glycosyltransferase YjiC (YdhE family)
VFETPDGPPGYFGGLLPAESPAEKLLHAVLRKQVRIFKRLMFFLFRKTFRDAGLASVYREDGSEQVYSDEAILAVGLPELEFSRSYPGHFHFIGALNFTPPIDDERRPHFNEGKKHVLVTLGTHLGHRKDAIAERIREMADRFPGWVFHFSDGTPAAREVVLEPSFHRYPFVSYAEHIGSYDLVVHHGGSGIVWHCLSRGIPAVVMPLDFDQFDYAARLFVAGAARWVMEEADLEREISAAIGDAGLARSAARFARLADETQSRATIRDLLTRLPGII